MASHCFESSPRARRSLSRSLCFTFALIAGVAASTLTGCGIGAADTSTTPLVTPAINGSLYGGPTPIVGATVKMYATGNSSGASAGYGVGTFLQEATQQGSSTGQDTGSYGQFSFAGGYDCPAGQFAYVVATGGVSGGNSANNQVVFVGAMGRCEDLYNNVSGTYTGYKGGTVFVNELTTIAAAYALGHFTSISGGGASTVVSIGAPPTNNAAQVGGVSTGCVAGVGSCTTTAAAGLAHAFQNAATLVNVFANAGINTGANTAAPANSNAIVPRELINTIGNILISCVNSNGGSATNGTTNDGTACGQLFSATTIGANTPNNTLSAMINLAANPTLGGSLTAVDALFNLAVPASSVYQPSIASTSGLNDFSIAINYPPAAGVLYDNSGALDINDDFFATNAAAGGGTGSAPVGVIGFASNGTSIGSATATANLKYGYGLSVDAIGNGYFGNGSGSGINALGTFTFSPGFLGGAVTALPISSSAGSDLLKVYATAVDRANNLWAAGPTNSGTYTNTLYQCPLGISASSNNCVGQAGTTGAASSSGALLAVDPNQNIWTGSTASLAVLENTGTVASPSYPGTIPAADTASTGPNALLGIAFTGSASDPAAYVSGYKTGTTGVQTIGYTQSSGIGVASITAGTNQFGATLGSNTAMSGAYGDAADGAGAIWVADYNDHALFQTTPGATTPAAYKITPCAGGSTTCTTVFLTGANATKPTSVAVDSTGSVWITSVYATSPISGQIVEVIGSAAPAWPLLSLGKTGTP
jgi:hypothetical protein